MPLYHDTTVYPDLTVLTGAERIGPVYNGADKSLTTATLKLFALASSAITGTFTAAGATVNLVGATSVSVPVPTSGAHATTKAYVDGAIAGVSGGGGGGGPLPTVSANQVLAGPASGSAALAAARPLVSADLPANAAIPGTGALTVPVGTTAQQPGSPTNGMLRFNSTTSRYEWYVGAVWINHVRLTGETGVVDLTTAASVSVPTPTASGHAVTKAYADALLATPVSPVANSFLGWDNTSTPVARTLRRVVSGTTDTPTAADHQSTIEFTSSSAVAVTINNLGAGITFVVRRTGSGTVTLTAGSGVTLATTSDNASPSYAVLQHGTLVVYCEATSGSVAVNGKMA